MVPNPAASRQGVSTATEERKEITDLVAAAHLVHVGRVIRDRAQAIMVSAGIPPETQARLGFKHARTPQEAVNLAFELAGSNAEVAVLRHGGDVLPLVGIESSGH